MIHLFIQTHPDGNLKEIDTDPNNTVISILNLIEYPKKSMYSNSKIHFLYNGTILLHYLSFSFQGVANNSKITVVTVNQSNLDHRRLRQKREHPISIADQIRQKLIKFGFSNNSIENEECRLSDLGFSHLELSSLYSSTYNMQNVIQIQEKKQFISQNETSNPLIIDQIENLKDRLHMKLNLSAEPSGKSISEEPLPPCFNFSFM